MNGRIGVAQRIHILKRYENTGYGVSICGWAGFTKITQELATCQACLKEKDTYAKAEKSKEREILGEQVLKGNRKGKKHEPDVKGNRFF